MGEKSDLIYIDNKGSIGGINFKEFIDGKNIKLYRIKNHPAFAERFIRTFKDMLFKRLEADKKKGKDNIQQINYILEIILTYNNKIKHSATNMTPKEAKKKDNKLKARVNIAMKVKKEK